MAPATEQATEKQTENKQGRAPQGKGDTREFSNIWQQRTKDLRSAFENLAVRYETYDPDTLSNEDAKALYIDTMVFTMLAAIAADDVRRTARKQRENAPFATSLDRLGVGHLKSVIKNMKQQLERDDDE